MKTPLIGTTWVDSKGRTWEVTKMVNPGKYQVCVIKTLENGSRIATRIGEMYVAGIQAAVAATIEKKIRDRRCPECGSIYPCCH